MKYVRQFRQRTVKADDPRIFDEMVNAIYLKASESGKDPEIHYYDSMGFCATIRYYVHETIPENSKDEYELAKDYHFCMDCPYFVLPKDRRVRYLKCLKDQRTAVDSRACVIFYDMLKGGLLHELPDGHFEEKSVLPEQTQVL